MPALPEDKPKQLENRAKQITKHNIIDYLVAKTRPSPYQQNYNYKKVIIA